MEILQGFVDAVVGIFEDSGLLTLNWQNYVMIGISIVLLYLAIKKQYEPLLLLPIAFGMLLVNLYPSIMAPPTTQLLTEAQCTAQNVAVSGHAKTVIDGVTYIENPTYGGLLYYLYQGVKLGIYPPLIFLGIGCMTDFGPLISNPKSLILGAAAQIGIFLTFTGAIFLGFTEAEAGAIGIIGGADGPTAIYVTTKLAPHLLGSIAIAAKIEKIRQIQQIISDIEQCEYITSAKVTSLDLGKGYAEMAISIESELFYKVISEETGLDITEEYELLNCIKTLSQKQKEFDKIAQAYEQVQETGYGIVMPTIDELTLDEPQIIKQSGKYGIKLRASAPSIHMMKIFTQTEVTPIVGSEQQSEELVSYLLREFDENPEKIWESNIFGKSVHELVNEGLHNKLYRMPADARRRIGETVEKIINDGCNGLICIIL